MFAACLVAGSSARTAVVSAENNEAAAHAPVPMDRAKEKLRRAQVAMQQKDYAEASDNTAKQNGAVLRYAAPELQHSQADADSLRRELLALQAVKTERGMVMTLGDVLFATAKADLQPGADSTIQRLAGFLEEYPEKTVLIEGFTDSTGGADFNQGLSERRALAVRQALVNAGVSATRISTEGFGMSRPVADNATAEGRQMNRRVEIVIQD